MFRLNQITHSVPFTSGTLLSSPIYPIAGELVSEQEERGPLLWVLFAAF